MSLVRTAVILFGTLLCGWGLVGFLGGLVALVVALFTPLSVTVALGGVGSSVFSYLVGGFVLKHAHLN